MIKGEVIKEMYSIQKTTVNYRSLGALNCSMIKLFDRDPVKFFEQFKLGKDRKDKTSTALIIGDIVDFYILDCKGNEQEFESRWDEKFAMFDGIKTGQVFTLGDTLFEIAQENTNPETGKVDILFETMFKEAFQKVQALGYYKGKTEEKALENFNDNGIDYYQSLLDNVGKTVVDISLVEKAKKIAKNILEDEFTYSIFEDGEDIEFFPKIAIEWVYTTRNDKKIQCKSEPDILKVDHFNKKIFLFDVKTTFDNENFEYSYVKNKYYLQAAFYSMAVAEWAKQEGMGEYMIVPMQFIVGDTSSNNRRPILYDMSKEDLEYGIKGFNMRGTEYKGVNTLLEEISWAEDNDIWNCSKETFDNKGVMNIKLKYE